METATETETVDVRAERDALLAALARLHRSEARIHARLRELAALDGEAYYADSAQGAS